MKRNCGLILCLLGFFQASICFGQTYYYVGPFGGDFFDELNWNDAADGSGANPAGDPIVSSTTNAIALDLIIDGDTVDAAGEVDFGTGSLTLESGSVFTISAPGADLDINSDSTFSLTDATLTVDDIINFEGVSLFSGGTVTSLTDDIAFQDNFINLSIDGTTFITTLGSSRNVYFDGFVGSIKNASFTSGDRFGIRNNTNVVMTDTSIDVEGGTGDIDDVFAAAGAGSSLTLLGASSLLADSVEEGVDLLLGGTTTATMGAQGSRIVADGSTITLLTTGVSLVVSPLDPFDIDYVDARPFLINGNSGMDYATSTAGWNITDWNGFDAATLRIVPEPSSGLLLVWGCVAAAATLRRRKSRCQ